MTQQPPTLAAVPETPQTQATRLVMSEQDLEVSASAAYKSKSKISSGQDQQEQHSLKVNMLKSKIDLEHIKTKNELEIQLLSVHLKQEQEVAKMLISHKQESLQRIQKYEEQQSQMEFNVSVCLARKKLRDAQVDNQDLNHLVPGMASIGSFPEQISEYFQQLDGDSIPLQNFLVLLANDFSPLFYSSVDLSLQLSPFHDDLTIDSLETVLAGKSIHLFLEPFRLRLKDRNRALREIKSRLPAIEKNTGPIPIQKTVIDKGYLDIAEALVKAQVDLSDEELDGGALYACCKNNNTAGLQCCIVLGLDVDSKHHQSGSGLHWAAHNGNTAIVKLLLDAGANVNILSNNLSTPLYAASIKGHIDIVKLLLQHGAQKMHETKEGKTAYSIAEEKGFLEICDLLKES